MSTPPKIKIVWEKKVDGQEPEKEVQEPEKEHQKIKVTLKLQKKEVQEPPSRVHEKVKEDKVEQTTKDKPVIKIKKEEQMTKNKPIIKTDKIEDNKISLKHQSSSNPDKINKCDVLLEKYNKGHLCSVNGNNYEKMIYYIVKNCTIDGQVFNTQNEKDLGGSSSSIDIQCNFIGIKNIGIEAKKYNTPDWVQCSIRYHAQRHQWEATPNGKIPQKSRELFNELINNVKLFNGKIPPFMTRVLTHEEWLSIKKSTDDWNDQYINIPNDTIKKLYSIKGCHYIQISDGYGLYHLGNDICYFGIPEFITEQRIRVRTKIHSRKNKKGFCDLSVTIACQPTNITSLGKSPYSLDNIDKLPSILIYNFNQ